MRQDYEYLSPVAIKEFNVNKNKKDGTSLGFKTLQEFAQNIVSSMEPNNIVSHMKTNEKGFIQIWLHDELIETEVNQLLSQLKYP
jgi:arginyl-tRNA synthetase